jgi:hypothetical protein
LCVTKGRYEMWQQARILTAIAVFEAEVRLSSQANTSFWGSFIGWRSRVGITLLVIAVAQAVLWMRSYTVRDEVRFVLNARRQLVTSERGALTWYGWNLHVGDHYWPLLNSEPLQRRSHNRLRGPRSRETVRSSPPDLDDALIDGSGQFRRWGLPYWIFVLATTSFSGSLILLSALPRKLTDKGGLRGR